MKTVLQEKFFVTARCEFPLTFNHSITFKEEIKPHTFKAIYENANVIVKFVESYGEAAHKFCASKKIAPELIICE